MDMKAVVEAGGHGIDTMIDNVAKLRASLPEEARALADSAVGVEVAGMLSTASERAEVAKHRAVEAAEAAKVKAAEAAEVARARAEEIREVAEARAEQASQAAVDSESRRSRIPLVLTALALTGAAAAAGVLVWRKRQAAEAEVEVGEEWAVAVGHVDSVADDQSPDSIDPELAEEIDEVAEELAEEIVEAVVGEEIAAAEAEAPMEPFVPGVADEQSPDAVDESFAAELDAVADVIAEEIVDAIEGDENKKHK